MAVVERGMTGGYASFEAVERMDRELARLARLGGVLRFELGAGLEALARSGGHHELGFASLEAYALERCERSSRWVQESRGLSRRLAERPALRQALIAGEISFSMAQVVSRVARAEDESSWLAIARTHTVREVRKLTKQFDGRHSEREGSGLGGHAGDEDLAATLKVTVDREDAWLFECARKVVGARTAAETIEALLAEGTTSLLSKVDRDRCPLFEESACDTAQREWEAELSRWKEEAEARCEATLRSRARKENTASALDERGVAAGEGDVKGTQPDQGGFDLGVGAVTLDFKLREMAAELARRDLAVGQLAEVFWKADGWRRLGYATEAQYARDRLGLGLSSIKAKRALGRSAQRLPRLSSALKQRELGYEAARLVAAVATPDTVQAWIERATERTVRFLREEVDAARMLSRLAPQTLASPPTEETMDVLALVESQIVSGAVFRNGATESRQQREIEKNGEIPKKGESRSRPESQMSAGCAPSRAVRASTRPRSRALRHAGRVALCLRVTSETRRYYRWLEELCARTGQHMGPERVSFLRFLCCALLEAWKHVLGSSAEYASIYARDRYRCRSPVCGRRGVTPHHLRFRSAGGDDSEENLASLCVWCHLDGIHGGKLQASPPASDMEWRIGRTGHTWVRGRRRVA